MRIRFYTLGCKVNQYETQLLEELFAANGFAVVHAGEADIHVVNSCTVTATSDKKSRQLLRRLRRENPGALIALTGCMPQALPDTADRLPEADVVTGAKDRSGLLRAVRDCLMSGKRVIDIAPHLPGDPFEPMATAGFAEHTRAFLKIQDGCDKRCSYCIIPTARGHIRSKLPADITAEVKALSDAGFREVVLVGINLALYGAEMGLRLPDGIAAAAGLGCRIRIGSVDPVLLSIADLEKWATIPDVCPHFHLSLQSGCDATLSRMGRGYNTAQYQAMTDAIRRLFDNPAITTDIMVGFPGETEEEFSETMRFVEDIQFADAHIFEYSPRPGTPAATMRQQTTPDDKKRRSHTLAAVIQRSRTAFLETQVGTTAEVIAEESHKSGGMVGHSRNYTPVILPRSRSGEVLRVTIAKSDGEYGYGEPL